MKPSPSYLIKVTLKKTPKLIWRRLVVPSEIRLHRLHEILQTAMGWSEIRPHVFFYKKQGFHPVGQIPEGGLSEAKYTLSNLLVRVGGTLKYIHDPAGEKWVHEIGVEDVRFNDPTWPYPVCCIGGIRACPPSGIGGIDGFTRLLRALDDPSQAKPQGPYADFEPDRFDGEGVNRSLGAGEPRCIVSDAIRKTTLKTKPAAKEKDPFYRLGMQLKKAVQGETK